MADPRVIEIFMGPTFYQLQTVSSISLSDKAIQWNYQTETPGNPSAPTIINQYIYSAVNAPTIIKNADGSRDVINILESTISVTTGFTLRGAWMGAVNSPGGAAYVGDLAQPVDIFDNETIILRIRIMAKWRPEDVKYAEITYNGAGDKMQAALYPWARSRVTVQDQRHISDGTLVSNGGEGISKMNLADSVAWLTDNGVHRTVGNSSVNTILTPGIRKMETMLSPVRETDWALTTSIATQPINVKVVLMARYVVVFEKQVPVPIGTNLQLVLKEFINTRMF